MESQAHIHAEVVHIVFAVTAKAAEELSTFRVGAFRPVAECSPCFCYCMLLDMDLRATD